jgi:hypothetical protein
MSLSDSAVEWNEVKMGVHGYVSRRQPNDHQRLSPEAFVSAIASFTTWPAKSLHPRRG